MKKQLFILFSLIGIYLSATGQDFIEPINFFSKKEPCYLINTQGERIDFILSDYKTKKGLIIAVEGKKLNTEENFRLDAANIKILALVPSTLGKMNAIMEKATTITKWDKTDSIDRKFVFFEQHTVEELKDITALLQILNYGFHKKITIYYDPFAPKESSSIGGMGFNVTLDSQLRRYYAKIDGKVSRLKKREYDDEFTKIFSSCPSLLEKFAKNKDWSSLPKHIYFFEYECK